MEVLQRMVLLMFGEMRPFYLQWQKGVGNESPANHPAINSKQIVKLPKSGKGGYVAIINQSVLCRLLAQDKRIRVRLSAVELFAKSCMNDNFRQGVVVKERKQC